MHNSVSLVKKRKPSNLCIIFQWKNSYRTSELLLLSLLPSVQPKVLVIGMFMCLCVHKGGQKTHKVTVFLQNITMVLLSANMEKQSHFCGIAFL